MLTRWGLIYYEVMGYGVHEGDCMHISRHTFQMMLYAMMTGVWQKFMEYEGGPQSIAVNAKILKNRN